VESTARAGSFCTSVLRTADPDRAARFYSALIGWTTVPAAPDHAFLQFNGKTVASIQRIVAGRQVWIPHVCVDDIGRTTADAVALGATVEDGVDVPNVAKLATVRDPGDALFGLWQPAPHTGAEVRDDLGSIWWVELLARDIEAAREFYRRLFGWTVRETSFEPFDVYRVFERPGSQEGGLMPLDPEWGIPPVWHTFVAVEDCDRTLARACDLGGSTGFVHTVPKHGRIGGFFDGAGAGLIVRGPVRAPTT